MRLKFLGAADTVTGSRYLVTTGKGTVLVDCGLFQGFKVLRQRNWAPFPIDPAAIDAVLLTHAHLDHSGYLPLLISKGFKGPIYATPATAALCEILLLDSASLQEEDAARANRRGYSRHHPALPLYTRDDAQRALGQIEQVDLDSEVKPIPGFAARFIQAGHILGAASIALRSESVSVLFSGDLGRPSDEIMWPPADRVSTDYLVVESTYGNRTHPTERPARLLGETIRRTSRRGGVVLIASFAVGRAQTLLWHLHQLKRAGEIPRDLPIYLNSPMARQATGLYQRFPEGHRLSPKESEDMWNVAEIVSSAEDSRRLNEKRGPMVILAGSGMATGGRIVHHLRAFAGDDRNTIIFAGFQAGGTRGADILAGAESVRIFGADIPIRANVLGFDSLSAHADANELMGWLRSNSSAPKQTFATHGEPAAADALRARIKRELRWDVLVPEHLQSFDLSREGARSE